MYRTQPLSVSCAMKNIYSEYYNIAIIEEHNKRLIEKDKRPGLRSCVFQMTLKFSVNLTLRIISTFWGNNLMSGRWIKKGDETSWNKIAAYFFYLEFGLHFWRSSVDKVETVNQRSRNITQIPTRMPIDIRRKSARTVCFVALELFFQRGKTSLIRFVQLPNTKSNCKSKLRKGLWW